MDKASVLGDAIKYLKELQERSKVLEEQTKKRTVESVVFVKKSRLSADEDASSCEESSDGLSDKALPEIEAKISENDLLIRIHCENHRGIVVKLLSEIEKLHLSVANSSVLPFGNSLVDITVIAQVISVFSTIPFRTKIYKEFLMYSKVKTKLIRAYFNIIHILLQMNEKFDMTAMDLVKRLRVASFTKAHVNSIVEQD